MSARIDALETALRERLESRLASLTRIRDEVTITASPADLLGVARTLRDTSDLRFEQLVDLCGMDYLQYRDGARDGSRFAVVYHLLSITHNRRLRLRVFAADDDFPVVDSVVEIWPTKRLPERSTKIPSARRLSNLG